MAKYYVRVSAYIEEEHEIEAEDLDTAVDEAYDQMETQYGYGYTFEIEQAYKFGDDEEDD